MASDDNGILGRARDAFFEQYEPEDPVLERGDIERLDTIADAQDRYQQEGLDLSWDEAYSQLKEDWWNTYQDADSGGAGSGLPGESRTVTVHDEDGGYSADITVHGIVHGFPDHLPMSDELEELLMDETRSFLDQGDAVYVEQGFEEIFYNDWSDQYSGFHEMGDVEWMMGESGAVEMGAFGALFEGIVKPLSRYQGKAAKALSDLPEEYRSPGLDRMVTQIEALEDRETLVEAHTVQRAGQLPAPLREDGFLRSSAPDDAKTNRDGVLGQVEGRGREFMHRLTVGRSHAMAEEALEAVEAGEADHVRLVVGLGHQYDILEYLDGLDGFER